MYPVILNSENEQYGYNSFYEKFIQICLKHKEDRRALAFAFILYDFENPQISKVLQDTDYWLSLNKISGNYLTVFSIHYKQKVRYKRKPSSDSNVIYNMTMVSDYNNPSIGAKDIIGKYFGQDIDITFPSVMFFQIDDEKIVDYQLIELDETDIEGAFKELKTYIEKAVEVLKKVGDDYRNNNKEIFLQLENQIKGVRAKKIILRNIKRLTSLGDLCTSLLQFKPS